ncbi:hypothetical protein ACET3Z_002084 [Daucus carota]
MIRINIIILCRFNNFLTNPVLANSFAFPVGYALISESNYNRTSTCCFVGTFTVLELQTSLKASSRRLAHLLREFLDCVMKLYSANYD